VYRLINSSETGPLSLVISFGQLGKLLNGQPKRRSQWNKNTAYIISTIKTVCCLSRVSLCLFFFSTPFTFWQLHFAEGAGETKNLLGVCRLESLLLLFHSIRCCCCILLSFKDRFHDRRAVKRTNPPQISLPSLSHFLLCYGRMKHHFFHLLFFLKIVFSLIKEIEPAGMSIDFFFVVVVIPIE
jgi:hypothetical protein